MMKLIKLVSAAVIVALVAGCAAPADPEAMKPTTVTQMQTKAAYRSAIQVASVEGGKNTNPAWISKVSNEDFKLALEGTLKSVGYHSKTGKLQLNVNLLSVKQPIAGFNMTVTTVVDYNLMRSDGRSVFRKTITTPYTAAFSESLLGVTRLKKANEGSVRANIEAFITALNAS